MRELVRIQQAALTGSPSPEAAQFFWTIADGTYRDGNIADYKQAVRKAFEKELAAEVAEMKVALAKSESE